MNTNFLITGASKGIGHELAKYAATFKENTILAVGRNQKSLEHLKKDFPNIIPFVFDLNSSLGLYSNLKQAISKNFSSIDVIVNNAGSLTSSNILDIGMEEVENQFKTNVFAPIKVIKITLEFLKENSHIVNIGSMAGLQNAGKIPGLSAYSASKGAIASLTEGIAIELLPRKIFANCLMLGGVETEMFKSAFPGVIPPMKAENMAKFIYNFSLNSVPYMTGKVIPVSVPGI